MGARIETAGQFAGLRWAGRRPLTGCNFVPPPAERAPLHGARIGTAIDLKLTRLARDPRHLDSLWDLAGYAAVLSEVSR